MTIDEYIAAGCPAIAALTDDPHESDMLVRELRPFRLRPIDPANCRVALDSDGLIASVFDPTREGAADCAVLDDTWPEYTGPCHVVDVRQLD